MYWSTPLILLLQSSLLAVAEVAIWPRPSFFSSGSDVLWLNNELQARFECGRKVIFHRLASRNTGGYHSQLLAGFNFWRWLDTSSTSNLTDTSLTEASIVQAAVDRAINSILHTKFVPWKFHPRGSKFDPVKGKDAHYVKLLTIKQSRCPTETAFHPEDYFDGDESYDLLVDKEHFEVRSNSSLGTLRALESLKQLFYQTESGDVYVGSTPISIHDTPFWRHRGLSIDIARNPIASSHILKTIDAMATVKFSRLHIHATDSQSWPIEIPALPELAEQGAYQSSLVWTAADLEKVQAYGARRGMSVFVEIDVPGHTASVAHAYPSLIAAFNELDWSTFAAEPLSGQLKLNSQDVNTFMDIVLEDILPRLARYTSVYHIGGDELNENVYLLDETVQSNSAAIIQPLLQKFMSRVVNHVLLHGLQPIIWEEMILDWNLTLPKGPIGNKSPATLVQVWRNGAHISEVLQRGHRVIFGDHKHWYLDCGFGVGFLDPYSKGVSPPGVPHNTSGGFPSKLKPPYLDYCNPYHNWRDMFMYNPLDGVDEALHYLIEGGEALMWSEQTDGIDLEFKLWPRASAASEVLWSGPGNESMIENASRRLGQWRERAVMDLRLKSSPVHMTWCLMEGGCNL